MVRRGNVLGDVELELLATGFGLRRVVAGLVDRRTGRRVGGGLLQQVGHPGRGRRPGLVEERNDVEGFMLRLGVSFCPLHATSGWVRHLRSGTCWAVWVS